MERIWILMLVLALALAACGGKSAAPDTGAAGPAELIVFAAASMQETLTEIGENYQKEHPSVTLLS